MHLLVPKKRTISNKDAILDVEIQKEPTVSNGWTIVVVGAAKMTTVSKMRFVVGQGPTLGPHDFTKARASKWSKVAILPRPDAQAQVPSANNNILYRM